MSRTRAPIEPEQSSVRGFVMAGGRSSRMGVDKALLPWGASTLVDHAVARLREVTHDVRILCGPARRYENHGASLVLDSIAEAGPLAGLLAALDDTAADRVERCLWLGVDLPAVPAEFLRSLDERLRGEGDVDVVMARSARGDEPLCAAFRTATCRPAVAGAIAAGRLKLTDALLGVRVVWIGAAEAWFANVNTPDDYERLRR